MPWSVETPMSQRQQFVGDAVRGLFPMTTLCARYGICRRLRRDGSVSGRVVRTNAIERELTMLKGALNWARGVYEHGQPLLPITRSSRIGFPASGIPSARP